jgi:hypothetical protein
MPLLSLLLPTAIKIGGWIFDRIGASAERRAQFVTFMQAMQSRVYSSVDLRRETARQMAELRRLREAREAPKPEVKP